MNFFKQNPFVRFIIPLIFGILIQFYLSFNIIDIIWIFSVILVLTIAVLIINLSFSYQYIKGVFINLSIIIYGVLITSLHQSEYHKIETTNNTILTAKIVKTPKERESDYKLSLIIDGEKTNEKWRKTRSKAIAYLRKDSANIKLKAGDRIVFQTETLPVKQVNNPFDFDYYQYLSLKQIYNVFYIKNSNLFLTPNNTIDFKSKILNLREKIIDIYKQSGLTTNNLAILSALSLGYRDALSTDIRQAYIGAGAMHILAVSGLHVGIIYLILYVLFSWTISIFSSKRPLYAIVFILLWGYALLTGLSPSVFRATLMFSFVLIGMFLKKQLNIYNSIMASGFFLLIINPFLLFDIGFQLSYIAVLGIVYFYPKIYKSIYFRNRIFRWIWGLTAISISAQISTFPITTYYFNVFPIYFWLSNIVATIFATVLIFSSFILVIISPFPQILLSVGKILNLLLDANLNTIQWINNLPNSLITNISPSEIQVVMLYISIISIAAWLHLKTYKSIVRALISILFVGIIHDANYIKTINQKAICVYKMKYNTTVQFIDGNHSYWLTPKNNDDEILKLIDNANRYWNTSNNNYYNIEDTIIEQNNFYLNSNYFVFYNKNGIILDCNDTILKIPKTNTSLNYLIANNNIIKYRNNLKFNKIIAINKPDFYKNMSDSIYSIQRNGAFINKLN